MSKLDKPSELVTTNPWSGLRQFTTARIALGRAGLSMPTNPQLAFQLAHAQARDAVHHELNDVTFKSEVVEALGLTDDHCLLLQSAAQDRSTYLKRPDLGRRLSESSSALLVKKISELVNSDQDSLFDIAFVAVDGLSALAIENNAIALLKLVYPKFEQQGLRIAPFTIVKQGRVAIGDEIGELLCSKLVVVMIGERPGLSSPESMSLYITWNPRVGLTDESRNCISNIHRAGLTYAEAEHKLHYLVTQAHARQLTGVGLKDETNVQAQVVSAPATSFLLG